MNQWNHIQLLRRFRPAGAVLLCLSCLFLSLWLGIQSSPSYAQPITAAERSLLPTQFKVYTQGNTVINHPTPGFTAKILPTVNRFKGAPGCYVACYSRDRANSIYPVGGDIYVMGQVRVPGRYRGRICLPKGNEQTDISAATQFKQLCGASLVRCRGDRCWAGGDTGGWFGIP